MTPPPPSRFQFLRHRPEQRVRRSVALTAALLVIALLALTLSRPTPLVLLDALGYDLLLRGLQRNPPPSGTVIVDIDEKSLGELGQWPWPRYHVARLLDVIRAADVKAVGVDLVFPEPDRLSLANLRERFRRDLGVTIALDGVPAQHLDNDAVLAQALSHREIVNGIWFDFDAARTAPLPPVPLPQVLFTRTADAPQVIPLPRAPGALPPTPVLLSKVRSIGFLNSLPDSDGKIRRAPMLIEHAGRIYPSLALAAVMRALGETRVIGSVSAAGVEELRVGDIRIPTDRFGNMLLPFSENSRDRFERFSAADVIRGRVPAERLRGRLVFVGSSATAQNDVHPTPLDRQFPGIMVHGVAADTILGRDFLQTPSWTPGAQFLLVLISCLLTALMLSRFPLAVGALVCAAALAGLCLGSAWLFTRHGIFLSPVSPLLSLSTSFMLLGVIRFRGEEKAAIQRTRDLSAAQDCAIVGLVSVAETRDRETGNHVIRTQGYVRVLAEHLAKRPGFRKVLTRDTIETICKSAPLHDIGKVGVPDRILLKPGRLTEEEYAIMRQHTLIGRQALERAVRISGLDPGNSFLRYAEEIASGHHEHWDGKGYPKGLKGTEIPLSARLMAVADVYDAIRSRRHYKEALPHEAAVGDIRAGSGTQFDPDLVQAFLEIEHLFREISELYADDMPQWGEPGSRHPSPAFIGAQ